MNFRNKKISLYANSQFIPNNNYNTINTTDNTTNTTEYNTTEYNTTEYNTTYYSEDNTTENSSTAFRPVFSGLTYRTEDFEAALKAAVG